MPLFRRREPLHEQLAREGGLPMEWESRYEPLRPPGIPEVGITGNQRFREWDATAVAETPGLEGEAVDFVVLPDGSMLVDEDMPLEPLAAAIEETLEPPYRAHAVRRNDSDWAVGARKIDVLELRPDVEGETIELSSVGDERTLTVDGASSFGRIPQLEAAGESRAPDYALRARRLDGSLWEVDVTPL